MFLDELMNFRPPAVKTEEPQVKVPQKPTAIESHSGKISPVQSEPKVEVEEPNEENPKATKTVADYNTQTKGQKGTSQEKESLAVETLTEKSPDTAGKGKKAAKKPVKKGTVAMNNFKKH